MLLQFAICISPSSSYIGGMSETPDLPPEDEHVADVEESAEPLSLEALSAAYAQLIDGRPGTESKQAATSPSDDNFRDSEAAPPIDEPVVAKVDPQSILEAMLFVGSPDNEPLTSKQAVASMRGVGPAEVDAMVAALNEVYEENRRPYRIESVGAGYVLKLLPKYAGLRDKFYGRVREARLSQAAVDILAIVAYRQPLTREEIDKLRGRPSGSMLSQLVRRQLLRIERSKERPRRPKYFTTDRFLGLFGLESLAELPESHDLERDF